MKCYLAFKRMEILTQHIHDLIPTHRDQQRFQTWGDRKKVESGLEELLEMCLISPDLQDRERREF